jgi:hypothetical protein
MANYQELTAFIPQSAHQWKMRERLINARGKLQDMHHEEWCQLIEYTSLFARLGLKLLFNDALKVETPKREYDKIKLELDYNGFNYPTEKDKDKIFKRLNDLQRSRKKYRKMLLEIQEHHQVTGLDIVEYKFGEIEGEHQVIYAPGWTDESELPLIESDLDILNDWKDYLANTWKSGLNGYQIYRWDDEEKENHPCKVCSFVEFDAYLATCKWVEPWVRDGFPSINMGRETDTNSWGKVQTFTAIPQNLSVCEIVL